MMKAKIIGRMVYFIFGLYFINHTFTFVEFPEFILKIDKWLILIGGVLIITGGINYVRAGKKLKY